MDIAISVGGPPRDRLVRYLTSTTIAAVAVVLGALLLWPVRWHPSMLAFVLLYAAAEAHPVRVPQQRRARSVVVSEAIAGMACLALPPGQAAWVVVGGALLSVPAIRYWCSHEQMRHATPDRQLLNLDKNILGPALLVALVALAAPWGPWAMAVATAGGLLAHGAVTHLLVEGAICRASVERCPVPSAGAVLRESLPLAALLTAITVPVGLDLRGRERDWPLLALLGLALVLVSRARMGQDHAGLQATTVTTASERFATARSVDELERELVSLLGAVLLCRTVRLGSSEPPAAIGVLHARLGDAGPWVVADDRFLGQRWSRFDADLLRTVLAIAAPERRRLALLAEVQEAERFASLVLSAAGHDIGGRLHAAAMATETARSWRDRLSSDQREALLARSEAALRQAASMLEDLVAVGASGLGACTSGADLALFARSLSPGMRVVADNVRIAAPTTVAQRALENLVRNAARHHVDPDPIEVAILTDTDTTVRVEVRDRGPGLDRGMVETLFQPFSQLTDGQRRRGSLGLGLFIARGLAESVGGSLTYADRPGGGAVFTMLLPSTVEHDVEGTQERVVLGPRPDGDAEAAVEPRPRREVPDEDALGE